MKIADIVSKKGLVIDKSENILHAERLIILNDLQLVAVVDGDSFLGVICQNDFLNEVDAEMTVGEFLKENSNSVVKIEGRATIQEAAKLLSEQDVDYLVVLDNNKFLGILQPADIVRDRRTENSGDISPEKALIYLAMTQSREDENKWFKKINEMGYSAAVTQVGASAIDLPIKLRESAIVAAIAKNVISEKLKEKNAVSNAVRDLYSQIEIINRGLGGGFKLAIIRGNGYVTVAAYGKCGHALGSGPDHIFMGYSII